MWCPRIPLGIDLTCLPSGLLPKGVPNLALQRARTPRAVSSIKKVNGRPVR